MVDRLVSENCYNQSMDVKQRSNFAIIGSSLRLDQVNCLPDNFISTSECRFTKLLSCFEVFCDAMAHFLSDENRVVLKSPIRIQGRALSVRSLLSLEKRMFHSCSL